MLSYRHAFHAGNHADVLKHFIAIQLIDYMGQKEAPFMYIDTHAGAGLYALDTGYAAKNAGSIILNIYNALGNLMNQQKPSILAGENQLPVNLTGYAAGNYFVQVVDGASGKIGVLRMVKQ